MVWFSTEIWYGFQPVYTEVRSSNFDPKFMVPKHPIHIIGSSCLNCAGMQQQQKDQTSANERFHPFHYFHYLPAGLTKYLTVSPLDAYTSIKWLTAFATRFSNSWPREWESTYLCNALIISILWNIKYKFLRPFSNRNQRIRQQDISSTLVFFIFIGVFSSVFEFIAVNWR